MQIEDVMQEIIGICKRNGATTVILFGSRANKELASEYMAYIRQMAEEFGIENDVKAGALSR